MKIKFILLLTLVMICSTMLTGCAVSGTTWKLVNIEIDDLEDWDEDYISELDMTLEFKQDGTVVLDSECVGEWSQKDFIVSITSEDEAVDCKIIGNKLIIENEDTKMIFKKQ